MASIVAGLAALSLVVAVVPSAQSTALRMWLEDSPENIRSLLSLIAEQPDRKIVVGPCTSQQVLTLPEWIERDDIFYVDHAHAMQIDPWPEEREFWLIATNYMFCPAWTDETRERAERFRIVSPNGSTATLIEVKMPPIDPDTLR